MKPLVFLSYSHDDLAEAARLREEIREAGFDVWWDKDLLGGQDWKHEIRKAMRGAIAVLLCMSSRSLARARSGLYPEALDAIAAYRQRRTGEIYLIPVRFSECEAPLLEIDDNRTLDRLQYVDLFPPEKWNENVRGIVSSLRGALRSSPLTPTVDRAAGVAQGSVEPPLPALSGITSEPVIEEVRKTAQSQTVAEIERSARRKYVPELYIHRELEAVLDQLLPDDSSLAGALDGFRDKLHRAKRATINVITTKIRRVDRRRARQVERLTDVQRRLAASGVGSTTRDNGPAGTRRSSRTGTPNRNGLREEREELRRLLRETDQERAIGRSQLAALARKHLPVDRAFDAILEQSRPCDGRHRQTFRQLGRSLIKLQKAIECDLGPPAERNYGALATDAATFAFQHASHVAVIIDRAGGGKTNLLCHMAMTRAETQPSLFLPGRVPIEHPHDLLRIIADRLGFRSQARTPAWISHLDQVLSLARVHLTVFIDGINEARDIDLLNDAMAHCCEQLGKARVRFVISCRDIYWTFFENAKWTKLVRHYSRGQLYAFSDQEQEQALDRYLRHFKIDVTLGEEARERCRHPLLLRFFCQAYTPRTDQPTRLGVVEDIRLKPLFDDYWTNKMAQLKDLGRYSVGPSPEDSVFRVVRHMFEHKSASVTTEEFGRIGLIEDLVTNDSLYLRLLDEDIIIEELPTASVKVRRVAFVYEEFMEYTIAKELFPRTLSSGKERVTTVFKRLAASLRAFVNSLGVAEYLCAFCLDAGLYRTAFELIVRMTRQGQAWADIVTAVFSKYDRALEMLLAVDFAEEPRAVEDLRAVLAALGSSARSTLADVCVAVGLRLLFPHVLRIEDILAGTIPPLPNGPAECTLDTQRDRTLALLRIVARAIVEFDVNPIRRGFWRHLGREHTDTTLLDFKEVLRALWAMADRSSKRPLLFTYTCNGLFSKNVGLRTVAALITRDARGKEAQDVRRSVLAWEGHSEVRALLT